MGNRDFNFMNAAQPSLGQNYPNPFSKNTIISYYLPTGGHTYLAVHNFTGEKIQVLVDKYQSGGSYELYFNAGNLPSGLYHLQLLQNGRQDTKKMLIIR
jgi:hypothetical protein